MIPGHGRDPDGMLTVGGMRVDRIAEHHGTPALLLDIAVFDGALSSIQRAAQMHGFGVSYAAKALMLVSLARRLAPRNIGVDVASLGELLTVERGGIAAGRITLHGAGKTDDEIETAFNGRIGRLAVDSLDELRRIVHLSRGRSTELILRLNTGIEAHTHEFIRTGGDDSKFGLAPREQAQALEQLLSAPHLVLRGVHGHIGSQIFDAAPFEANAQLLAAGLQRCREASFARADTIVIGGGFAVRMHPESPDAPVAIEDLFARIATAVPQGIHVEIEPGRAVVAEAGTSLYRVMAIKRYARRTFVIVDGSMADNPRPALYGAYHHALAAQHSAAPQHPVTICGRSCENDELADAPLPQDIQAGDLLAFCTTGAYTYSMASNYNRFPRPPVVAIENGEASLWARRESPDDVLRNDV